MKSGRDVGNFGLNSHDKDGCKFQRALAGVFHLRGEGDRLWLEDTVPIGKVLVAHVIGIDVGSGKLTQTVHGQAGEPLAEVGVAGDLDPTVHPAPFRVIEVAVDHGQLVAGEIEIKSVDGDWIVPGSVAGHVPAAHSTHPDVVFGGIVGFQQLVCESGGISPEPGEPFEARSSHHEVETSVGSVPPDVFVAGGMEVSGIVRLLIETGQEQRAWSVGTAILSEYLMVEDGIVFGVELVARHEEGAGIEGIGFVGGVDHVPVAVSACSPLERNIGYGALTPEAAGRGLGKEVSIRLEFDQDFTIARAGIIRVGTILAVGHLDADSVGESGNSTDRLTVGIGEEAVIGKSYPGVDGEVSLEVVRFHLDLSGQARGFVRGRRPLVDASGGDLDFPEVLVVGKPLPHGDRVLQDPVIQTLEEVEGLVVDVVCVVGVKHQSPVQSKDEVAGAEDEGMGLVEDGSIRGQVEVQILGGLEAGSERERSDA